MGPLTISPWIVAASLLLGQPPATMKDVLDEAERLVSAGDMQGVADLLEHAYADKPEPEYLLARASAEILLGDCATATELLHAFIATGPRKVQASAARTELEKCAWAEPAGPAAKPVAAPPPASATPEPVPDPVRRPRDKKPAPDPLGWGLIGTGTLAAAAGVAMLLTGQARVANPGFTTNEEDFRMKTDRARRLGWAGVGVAGVGGALLVGGVVRVFLVRQRRSAR